MLNEARAAAALAHPNVVCVYDVGETSGMPYIVLELVNGSPLRRYLQDSTVSLPTGIFVFGAGVGLVVLVTAGLFLAFRALEARDRAPTAVASDPASAGSQRRSRHDQGERREERGRECDGAMPSQ